MYQLEATNSEVKSHEITILTGQKWWNVSNFIWFNLIDVQTAKEINLESLALSGESRKE